ncbi:hypothetical protein JCM15415_11470 [Methanobacterium movens]
MSKAFDVAMAGVISGIVAFTTSQIGVGGTIIGAVLGSMLYQIMSHYVKEPLEKVDTQKIETRIVYAIPLILILAIEIIYLLAPLYWKPQEILYFLQGATNWNLFRSIGTGLIVMGIYPIIQPENIQKKYGYVVLSMGIVILLRGFLDAASPLVELYSGFFIEFAIPLSIILILALSYVILSLFKESINIRNKDVSKKMEQKLENEEISTKEED